MRTFFFLQAIGYLCRIRKVPTVDEFEMEGLEGSEGLASCLVIEGIFYGCDANSTHIILEQATILKVYGDDPYDESARSELIRRAERASLNLAEVKEIRFDGMDITRDGMHYIRSSKNKERSEQEQVGDGSTQD